MDARPGVTLGAGDHDPRRELRRRRRRAALVRSLVVLGVLAAVLAGVVGWRASGIIKLLLRNWAVEAVAQQSGGVYRLELGRVRLNWVLRRVAMDSIRFTTNVGVNAKRAPPLPDLRVAFDRCTVSGVHLVALVLGRGFIAGSFRCRKGSVAVSGIRRQAGAAIRPFLVPAAVPHPPASVPRVRIARVDFPNVGLDVRLPHAGRGETRIALARVRWTLAEFAIDPADSAAASRPLFSRVVELAADSLVARPDSVTAARIAHLRASLTDSTLDAEGLGFAPSVPLAEFERGPYRPDILQVGVARMRVRGLDFGALALGLGVRARRITVDSLHVKLTSDYRGLQRSTVHRTPQQWIADLGQTVDVDSVAVHEGEVEYREVRPDQAGPGVLTFGHIEATAAPVRHIDGRKTTGDSLTVVATAELLRAGRLDVRIAVPLDAPTFDMAFSGTLGPMPGTAFNPVLEHLQTWKIAHGQVERVGFSATVRRGVARGAITPLYTDLSVRVTGHGSGGILGSGGIIGGAVRGLASLAANWTKVKGQNPDDPAKPPRSGPIRHAFTPAETLPGFLWFSLRDGLLAVLMK
jgi:hypothetical protein